MNPLEQLQYNFEKLTKAEQRAAHYIMNNPRAVLTKTANQIAQEADISSAAVIRMCQKIGFDGFSAFKYAVTSNLMVGGGRRSDFSENPYQEIIAIYNEYINRIPVLAPREKIIQLAQKILQANRIDILGVNRTAQSARQLSNRLQRMGVYNKVTDDYGVMLDDSELLGPGDIVIALSVHGQGIVNYPRLLEEFKEHGCFTVLVTMNNAKLKITKHTDLTITLPCISRHNNQNFYEDQIILYMFIEFLLYEVAQIKQNNE